MRSIINGVVTAAVAIAVPAFAETKPGTPTPTASATSSERAASDKRYCVESNLTGSRLAKKICKTRAQWLDEDGFDPLAPQK